MVIELSCILSLYSLIWSSFASPSVTSSISRGTKTKESSAVKVNSILPTEDNKVIFDMHLSNKSN